VRAISKEHSRNLTIRAVAEEGRGYHLNTGTTELLLDGSIPFFHATIDGMSESTVQLSSGKTLPVDIIVLATGYTGYKDLVSNVLGKEWGEKVTIGGRDEEEEAIGKHGRETGIPGVDIVMTNFGFGRFNTKVTALRVAAELRSLVDVRYTLEEQRAGNTTST
jgi:hypothetical protein